MQQTPQLLEAVLQRRSGNQQPVIGVKLFERLVQQRVVVLEPMRLVDHQTGPADGAQKRLVLQQNLVRRQERVKLKSFVSGMTPLVLAQL